MANSFVELKFRPGIRNKAVPVGHHHLWQGFRIYGFSRFDDLGFREDVGDQRINLVVLERTGRAERHRTRDVIEQGRCIWPVTLHRFDRSFACKRAAPAEQTIAAYALARLPCILSPWQAAQLSAKSFAPAFAV